MMETDQTQIMVFWLLTLIYGIFGQKWRQENLEGKCFHFSFLENEREIQKFQKHRLSCTVWYDEENSLIIAILCKEEQNIRSEDLNGDTDTNPWWLLAQIPKGEKKKDIQREILAVC